MLYDLSPPIDDRLAVWPGDEPPRREIKCHLKDGASVTLSAFHTTVHAGSHADGPNHYGLDAPGIDSRPLEHFIGPAQVITVDAVRGTRYGPDALRPRGIDIKAPRILFKTGTYTDHTNFQRDFAALQPELVDWLKARGVTTVGVDTPSVDLFDSKKLEAHNAFLRNDLTIIEGLILKDVPDGMYELIALPLKLVGYDGSPVRAILRTI